MHENRSCRHLDRNVTRAGVTQDKDVKLIKDGKHRVVARNSRDGRREEGWREQAKGTTTFPSWVCISDIARE